MGSPVAAEKALPRFQRTSACASANSAASLSHSRGPSRLRSTHVTYTTEHLLDICSCTCQGASSQLAQALTPCA